MAADRYQRALWIASNILSLESDDKKSASEISNELLAEADEYIAETKERDDD